MSTETLSEAVGYGISLAFLGYAVYAFSSILVESTKYIKDEALLFFQGNANKSLKTDYEKCLAGRFTYYDRLPEKLKVKFALRVKSFISDKEFQGRGELIVTDEMKVLIAASAVQLTFGLEKYRFDDFSKIIIYPESYYSRFDDKYHMGETNAQGIIVFSWKDFLEGYSNKSDAFNVGLHEMAHALDLEQHLGGDYDFYFASYFEKFSLIAKEEYQNVRDERESFLRDYAGTNRQEFFAVSVEYFFEKSEEFRKRLPEIYYNLSVLLNQDPLAANGEVKEEPLPDQNTIIAEVQSSFPVFTSSYYIFSPEMLLLPAALLFGYYIREGAALPVSFFMIMVLFFLVVFSIRLLSRLNKFMIYDKYLVVKNVFGKISGVYLLSKIISLDFLSGRGSDYFTLLIPSKGRIIKYSHNYKMKEREYETFTDLLRQKKIVVKN